MVHEINIISLFIRAIAFLKMSDKISVKICMAI